MVGTSGGGDLFGGVALLGVICGPRVKATWIDHKNSDWRAYVQRPLKAIHFYRKMSLIQTLKLFLPDVGNNL